MKKISRGTLESGKVLQALADNFINNRTEETGLAFLHCLRDSVLWVPTTVRFSERDEEELLKHLEVGYEFTTQDEVRMKPDILLAPDGTKWYPLFSNKDEVVGDYKNLSFSYVPCELLYCLRMAHQYEAEGVKGLVLDPFTRGETIPFEVADIMLQLPSKLEETI